MEKNRMETLKTIAIDEDTHRNLLELKKTKSKKEKRMVAMREIIRDLVSIELRNFNGV